jgi:DNA polymerase type B, organellar and viral
MTNPNYGVFDLETFIDIDNSGQSYSRVYALGFLTNNGNDLTTYYLTDHFSNTVEGSAKLVLMCIDNMLVPKYNKFIFYVHNLGRFDVIFLHKILLDYNLTVKNKYILDPLYRDNQIIRLIVKLKNNNKEIKIAFVDSLNLLNSSLAKLCLDYGVDTIKGIFPYLFVNKDNLNYVGKKPDIKYYNNNNIDFAPLDGNTAAVYNSIPSEQWELRAETLKYLGKDLNSLLEILDKFQDHL